jgi:hypothetical protein
MKNLISTITIISQTSNFYYYIEKTSITLINIALTSKFKKVTTIIRT